MEQIKNVSSKSDKENSTGQMSNHLEDISKKLISIEKGISENKESINTIMEISKIIFGGWPVFGLLFLILFYTPLKDVFEAFPEKIKSANEISMGNVSFKTTIKKVAELEGAEGFGNIIPDISETALKLLFQVPEKSESAFGFMSSTDGKYLTQFFLPSKMAVEDIMELKAKNLIDFRGGMDYNTSVINNEREFNTLLENIKTKFPGNIINTVKYETKWALDSPISNKKLHPRMTWELTDDGKKVVSIILTAVSKEL